MGWRVMCVRPFPHMKTVSKLHVASAMTRSVPMRGLIIGCTVTLAASWHGAQPALRHACRSRAVMLPPNGVVSDGFLVLGYEEKAEAEQALGVVVSSDESLWEANAFAPYSQGGEWKQKSIERVVLLFTYIALNSFAKLRVRMGPYSFKEFADVPWGEQEQNDWVVHGYVNERVRIVRSRDGQSIGQWFLQTLEPDATPNLLKYEMMPGNGGSLVVAFERA